ncbi:dihydropteroate synthase [Vibrio lentus]|nr:dihydropteroate synthase [Vibrio lentus]
MFFTDVEDFLKRRVEAARSVGIPKGQLILDPGFGFVKTSDLNPHLLLT